MYGGEWAWFVAKGETGEEAAILVFGAYSEYGRCCCCCGCTVRLSPYGERVDCGWCAGGGWPESGGLR